MKVAVELGDRRRFEAVSCDGSNRRSVLRLSRSRTGVVTLEEANEDQAGDFYAYSEPLDWRVR